MNLTEAKIGQDCIVKDIADDDDELKNPTKFDAIITGEMALIDGLQLSQNSLKNYINTYVEEISTTFANDEVFKNMLLASLETALLQIGINTQDLTNLYNILDIILREKGDASWR